MDGTKMKQTITSKDYSTLLTKNRKQIMKDHGFYTGPVNTLQDNAYWRAVLKVNQKYLPKRYQTTDYYEATDIVLRNLRAFTTVNCHSFKLEEFVCGCGGKKCSGYPAVLKQNLLRNLQTLRDYYNQPVTITCGLRCQAYNDSLQGSVKASKHITGKAADIYVSQKSDTVSGRKQIISKWMTLPAASYAYQGTTNMGNATHVDIK